MCKPIYAISLGGCLVLCSSMYSAEAKQCVAEVPSNPPRHWSYRLIDGRKCWYEGENNFPKGLLQWPEQNTALSAFDKVEPPKEGAQPVIPQAVPVPRDADAQSFEARWGALEAQQH